METLSNATNRNNTLAVAILLFVLFAGGGYIAYVGFTHIKSLNNQIEEKDKALRETQEKLTFSQQESANLVELLRGTEEDINNLQEELATAKGGLKTLTKLTTIDPELLKKYSKIYFLNEHYRPDKLELIDKKWWYPGDDDEFIHAQVWPFLEDLLEDVEDDNIDLRIISAFRTFDTQRELKAHYNVVYGEGTANQFSAAQGYSEHQLGTTVDFTTTELKDNFTAIAQTEAYTWLQKNAYKYGFVLSYPENNAYYRFEPWHWRFVGQELSEELHDQKINFYDMDQREIDSYRLNLFED